MSADSAISWTDHTFNPWWGCVKVSPGCQHCYAETLSNRFGGDVWGVGKPRRTFGDSHWNDPLRWDTKARTASRIDRVFTASMADVFEDRRDLDAPRARLFALVEQTPNLQWLILSKRADRMVDLAPASWRDGWPANAVAMTSVENQRYAEHRLPELLRVPAPLHGVSVEPLLGPVDLTPWLAGLDWVIVGGESGPGARTMQLTWATDVMEQCRRSSTPFFMKQLGAVMAKKLKKATHKGEAMADLPPWLRVREFPSAMQEAT